MANIKDIVDKSIYGLKVAVTTGLSVAIISACSSDNYKTVTAVINTDTSYVSGADPVTEKSTTYAVVRGDTVTYQKKISGTGNWENINVKKKNGVELEFRNTHEGFHWSTIGQDNKRITFYHDNTEKYDLITGDKVTSGYDIGSYRDGWNAFKKLKEMFGERPIKYESADPKKELKQLLH